MAQRKQPSAIGLSMLDLISNSLAAVIILFIIISSIRLPFIPPERYEGTLFIRYELKDKDAETTIWIRPPKDIPGSRRFWKDEIDILNTNEWIFNNYSNSPEEKLNNRGIPYAMVYSPIDSNNVHYLVIRNPIKGNWETGLILQDHENYEKSNYKGLSQSFDSKIKAWFVGAENKTEKIITDTDTLQTRFSTHYLPMSFGRDDIEVEQ